MREFDSSLNELRINEERFRTDFEALSEIGSTGDGGVHRPSFSKADLEAREWFRNQIEKADLGFSTDGAGNYSALLPCGPKGAPSLILGSHLDSVPYGGRFDGALGVVAALEVLRVLKEKNISLPVNLEAVDLSDEEATLVGELGSLALVGELKADDLKNPRGGRAALEEALARAGLTESGVFSAKRDMDKLAGYLELHIEQGLQLINSGTNIGIVTSSIGFCSYRVTFMGQANHAGGTSMEDRKDAGIGAFSFAIAARALVMRDFPGCRVNVGNMRFEPGAFNIIPGKVEVSMEFRAPETNLLDDLEAALVRQASVESEKFGLEVSSEWLGRGEPVRMSEIAEVSIKEASDALRFSSVSLTSGAGHDANSFAPVCPTGMIFIPSVDGFSHSPYEYSDWDDCVNGANVLLQSAIRMAYKVNDRQS